VGEKGRVRMGKTGKGWREGEGLRMGEKERVKGDWQLLE